MFGRATSFAAAMLAVLTLVASGGFHELLHADEPRGPQVQAAAAFTADGAAAASTTPEKAPAHRGLPQHGCSGHCTAHAAAQAPILVAMPTPLMMHAGWRLDRGLALRQHATSGLDRPPRA